MARGFELRLCYPFFFLQNRFIAKEFSGSDTEDRAHEKLLGRLSFLQLGQSLIQERHNEQPQEYGKEESSYVHDRQRAMELGPRCDDERQRKHTDNHDHVGHEHRPELGHGALDDRLPERHSPAPQVVDLGHQDDIVLDADSEKSNKPDGRGDVDRPPPQQPGQDAPDERRGYVEDNQQRLAEGAERGEKDDEYDQQHEQHQRRQIPQGPLLAFELTAKGHIIARGQVHFPADLLLSFRDEASDIPLDDVAEDDLPPHHVFPEDGLRPLSLRDQGQFRERNPFSARRVNEEIFNRLLVVTVALGKADEDRREPVRLIDIGSLDPVESCLDDFGHLVDRDPEAAEPLPVEFDDELGDTSGLLDLQIGRTP